MQTEKHNTKQPEHQSETARALFQELMLRHEPVYIADSAETLASIGNSAAGFYLDDINKALTSAEGVRVFNDRPAEYNPAPVILLSKQRNSKGEAVIKILRNAGITVYLQDANAAFKPITCTDSAEVKKELLKQYQANFSAGGTISEFDNVIRSNANTPAIATGFKQLDAILDGGLYEGLYTIGAISSLGKTTFCENIADNIASRGQDVIILSLEMSKFELIAKSISRLTFTQYLNNEQIKYEWCKTARGITDGSRYQNYSNEEKQLIKAARDHYAQNIGQHLFIHEAIGDMTAETARDIVQRHIDYTGNRPILIIDYLQLLQNEDKYINGNDKQRTDANVTALKRLSRDYKIPVIAISSVNRASYDSEINFAALKESGAIEFSSDVVIGLQLAGVGKSDFNVNEAKAKDPREIELITLKNRQAKTGDKISFYYYPMFNNFMEIVEE